MFGDRVSLYLTEYVERKHAEDNRNDYPLVVAMVPDKCAWMTYWLPGRLKKNLETSLESCSARQASKYDVEFRALYGEGEYYIKMDLARRRWIKIKAGIFAAFSVALNLSLIIKQKKKAVCKRMMANKHKEHKNHKLVGCWTRVVVFELLSSLNYAENYTIVFSLNCTENMVDFALKKDC